MEADKNKAGKNKINPSSELIFNYISGMPFGKARKNFLAAALLQKSLELQTLANQAHYSVYELQFWHKSATSSGYQLRIAAWANGEMTHVQLFRQAQVMKIHRLHNFAIFGLRLALGLFLYGMIYYTAYISPFLAFLFGLLAIFYSRTFVNDFKFVRENPYIQEDEALIVQLVESELGDKADVESPESLSLEDFLEEIARQESQY